MSRSTNRAAFAFALLTTLFCVVRTSDASDLTSTLANARTLGGNRLVAIVTADIDSDGDLDVIASDSALQIHVWVNDGSGHLTPRTPAQSTMWQGLPALPSVDARPITSESCTPASPLSVEANVRTFALTLTAAARLARTATTPHRSTAITSPTPRAPPAR